MIAAAPAAETATSKRACLRCRELEQENEVLSKENRTLKEQVQRLKRGLERSERAGKRQAAPFSKGPPAGKPRKPGRRPGSDYGTPARRAVPEHVDETVEVPLPEQCPDCGGEVEARSVAEQYQTELPPIRPHVTRFRVHLGSCTKCRRSVRGRHPRQTSDALGAAASQLGPRAVSVAAHLNKGLGLSFEKTSTLYRTVFSVQVTPSGLCQALDRMAQAAEPTYDALVQSVRAAPVVSPDETGWKVGGELTWLWAFATPDLSVYAKGTPGGASAGRSVQPKGLFKGLAGYEQQVNHWVEPKASSRGDVDGSVDRVRSEDHDGKAGGSRNADHGGEHRRARGCRGEHRSDRGCASQVDA